MATVRTKDNAGGIYSASRRVSKAISDFKKKSGSSMGKELSALIDDAAIADAIGYYRTAERVTLFVDITKLELDGPIASSGNVEKGLLWLRSTDSLLPANDAGNKKLIRLYANVEAINLSSLIRK